ncbi:MAG: shikimate dehydrogenase [Deltaproteobacteria bacterium]|nr:shikimate dehydrogenase [Deltaproteobacteria bacterium]MDQ3295601.1 shikimate dehydrogenase [Myxococcota bacterium]
MITGATRLSAVIGWPVAHSRSPHMLNAAFAVSGTDAVMVPIAARPERFAGVISGLRAMSAIGASVTVPHKLTAAALCDQLAPAARETGAVNCLHFDGDRLVGHNTDAPGFVDGLIAAGFARRDVRAVLLGAGGAARAVAYGLREHATVEVLARAPDRVLWTKATPWTPDAVAAAFAHADLVVDCTPAGLAEHDERTLVDALPLHALPASCWVATLIYHRATLLVERARERGHSTVDGRAMLVHQGARAFTIWTGAPAPIDAMARALDDALRGT